MRQLHDVTLVKEDGVPAAHLNEVGVQVVVEQNVVSQQLVHVVCGLQLQNGLISHMGTGSGMLSSKFF